MNRPVERHEHVVAERELPERDAARRLEPIIAHGAPRHGEWPHHARGAAFDAQTQRRRRRGDAQLLVEFLRRAAVASPDPAVARRAQVARVARPRVDAVTLG